MSKLKNELLKKLALQLFSLLMLTRYNREIF